MGNFMDKAQEFAGKHDKQVDQGIEKAGEQADRRTGGRYAAQVDKGVDEAQRRTGQGDESR
jgi:hypothetical protein